MYQPLYASVPDADAYLERIHSKRPAALTKESLDELVYAHQCSVPFENLDVWMYKKDISLDIAAIYDKVVTRHRGGYCFELNALFAALLRELGFQASSCMCRITRNKNYVPLVLHRGIIVELKGSSYFCDVGYGGPMPPVSVPVRDGARVDAKGETYFIFRGEEPWWELRRKNSSGEMESMMQFYTMYQEPVNFIPLNDYCAKSPDSVFCQRLYVNRRTEDGSVSLTGNRFTRMLHGRAAEERQVSPEEAKGILKDCFEIEVSGELILE